VDLTYLLITSAFVLMTFTLY